MDGDDGSVCYEEYDESGRSHCSSMKNRVGGIPVRKLQVKVTTTRENESIATIYYDDE